MKLYSYWRSSSAWRVRIRLAWKGVPYTYEAVHLLKDGGQQHQEQYRDKNPMGFVPLLEWQEDGNTRRLSQSMAILDYLELRFPDPPYCRRIRSSAPARASWRRWSTPASSRSRTSAPRLREEHRGRRPRLIRHFLPKGLAALETVVQETAGKFCIGDTPTLAESLPGSAALRSAALQARPRPLSYPGQD
jgi:maleylpyruvate isomerase